MFRNSSAIRMCFAFPLGIHTTRISYIPATLVSILLRSAKSYLCCTTTPSASLKHPCRHSKRRGRLAALHSQNHSSPANAPNIWQCSLVPLLFQINTMMAAFDQSLDNVTEVGERINFNAHVTVSGYTADPTVGATVSTKVFSLFFSLRRPYRSDTFYDIIEKDF